MCGGPGENKPSGGSAALANSGGASRQATASHQDLHSKGYMKNSPVLLINYLLFIWSANLLRAIIKQRLFAYMTLSFYYTLLLLYNNRKDKDLIYICLKTTFVCVSGVWWQLIESAFLLNFTVETAETWSGNCTGLVHCWGAGVRHTSLSG